MKKSSKVIRKDYTNYDDIDSNKYYDDGYKTREYYGLLIKNGKVRIDVKRYSKFFKLPDGINKPRNTVYFIPAKKRYEDYNVNKFLDAIDKAKSTWYEQKNAFYQMCIDYIKKQRSKPTPNYDYSFQCGILEYDEWEMSNRMAAIMHKDKIEREINDKVYNLMITLRSQSIHMIASHLEHAMVETMVKNGWQGDKAGRLDIFNFVGTRLNSKKGEAEARIRALKNFEEWDKFYSIWNFCKHNTRSTYNKILKKWPALLYRKGIDEGFDLEFPSDLIAIQYLKLDEKYFNSLFEPLKEFYMEFCKLVYDEEIGESKWNYAQYFIDEVDSRIEEEIELYENPAGLSPWL